MSAARYRGQGAGGGLPGQTITEVSSAFLGAHDFVRVNNPVLGDGWVQELATSEILANLARVTGAVGSPAFAHRPNADATAANIWVQAVERHSSTTTPAVLGLFNTDPFAGRDGYQVRADTFGGMIHLERNLGGALTAIANVGVASLANTFYTWQFGLTFDGGGPTGAQLVDWWRQAAPASIRTMTGADANAAANANKRASIQTAGGAIATSDWESVLLTRGALNPTQIVCTGMIPASGDKIRVTDPADVLIAEATEVAGTATIDIHGVASGLEWPLTGHNKIKLTTAANVLLSEIVGAGFIDAGVFPGGVFLAV